MTLLCYLVEEISEDCLHNLRGGNWKIKKVNKQVMLNFMTMFFHSVLIFYFNSIEKECIQRS